MVEDSILAQTARKALEEQSDALRSALADLKRRVLNDGPCFCTDYSKDVPPSYFENQGAKNGHDNGFRHSSECLAARSALWGEQ